MAKNDKQDLTKAKAAIGAKKPVVAKTGAKTGSNTGAKTSSNAGAKTNDKISIFKTSTTTTNGVKSTTKTEAPAPGKAWVKGPGANKNFWVKPKAPAGADVAWDDNNGWVTAATQATLWDIPLAVIKSDAKLEALFNEAWALQKKGQELGREAFITKLQALDWYKDKSVAQRKYYTLSRDPAQAADFAAQVAANKATVQDVAGLLGASLTDAQIDEVSRTNLQNGFNESELRNFLSSYIKFSGQTDQEKIGSLYGQAGETEDSIRAWAADNNVTIAEDWVLKQVKSIAAGDFAVDKSKDYITNIAKQQYSAWADKLDGTNTINDLAAGVRNLVADEFGESLDNITIKNKYVDAAMKAVDDQGKPVGIQTTLKTIRKTDDWVDVPKNKEKVLQVGQDILNKFGMR